MNLARNNIQNPLIRRTLVLLVALSLGCLSCAKHRDAGNGGILTAARDGDLEKVKTLLKEHHDLVFSQGSYGRTPLHWAAEYDHPDVAEFLLASKSEVDAKDDEGNMPLHLAAFWGHKDIVELLLTHHANANAKATNGDTPLHDAAFFGRKDVVELLLANDAEVNCKDKLGRTPLRLAMSNDQKAVVELLRQHGGHE